MTSPLSTPQERSAEETKADFLTYLTHPAPNAALVAQLPFEALAHTPKLLWKAVAAQPLAHISNPPNGLYVLRHREKRLLAVAEMENWAMHAPIPFDQYAYLGPLNDPGEHKSRWRFVG